MIEAGTEVHKYTWQGGKLIAEQYGDTELEFFYDESGAPFAFSYKADANAAEQIFYYVTNLQGDVMQILDAGGNTVASYTYNAWGKILNLNNSTSANIGDLNPIRYRGYYYDTETGLYYLKSRYYDPEICRFINADSLASTGQGFVGTNMFAYCLNTPVNGIDSNGYYLINNRDDESDVESELQYYFSNTYNREYDFENNKYDDVRVSKTTRTISKREALLTDLAFALASSVAGELHPVAGLLTAIGLVIVSRTMIPGEGTYEGYCVTKTRYDAETGDAIETKTEYYYIAPASDGSQGDSFYYFTINWGGAH